MDADLPEPTPVTALRPEALEIGIDTRDEIDLAQCSICFAAVFQDVEQDHQDWHHRQDRIQVQMDVAISELWAAVRTSKQSLIATLRES